MRSEQKEVIHRLTQHKRFVPYGTHPNPSLTLRTSSMPEPLDTISIGGYRLKVGEEKDV